MSRYYTRKYYKEWKATQTVCEHCGGTFLPCQIDIHHIDETTKNPALNGWSSDGTKRQRQLNIRQLGSIRLVKEEIAKCIPLCKNCHALHHYNERQKCAPKNIEDFMS